MRFVVLIPSRLTSTRLPNKPLADIGGIPMVVRVAQQALKSHAHTTVVAADNSDILDVCAQFGIPAVLTKADHSSGSDRLAEACELLQLADNEVVVNVQGDEPLIDPLLINSVAQTLHSRPDCVMSTAACSIIAYSEFTNPHVVKVVTTANQTALYFSRAAIPAYRDKPATSWWDSPSAMAAPLRHVGIYGYRVSFLKSFPQLAPAPSEQLESLEQLRVLWHGHRIAVHLAKNSPGPGVDTPEDLEHVRRLIASS